MPLDFVVRPQSKIDPDEIRARAKQVVQDQRRLKVSVLFLCKVSKSGYQEQISLIILLTRTHCSF